MQAGKEGCAYRKFGIAPIYRVTVFLKYLSHLLLSPNPCSHQVKVYTESTLNARLNEKRGAGTFPCAAHE
jgi:hypothetical protein